ncbi:MAG TPA: PIN domain-containing protein [Candidatus Angelobacter sp.]|nr:PIN domain-containing protein [Candidatus Angelobacter sp.]
MRLALDTNVLVYAEGVNGAPMQKAALELIQKLPDGTTLVPVQALGELFHVLVRKAGRSATKAHGAILGWRDAFPLIETSASVMLSAVDLAKAHHIGIWDAVILSASAEAGCRLLLSEDLQDGFTWRGVTIANPFAKTKHVLLTTLLGGTP